MPAPLEAAAAALAPAAVGLFGGIFLKERRRRGSGACCFFCAALVPLRSSEKVREDREDAEQAVGSKSMHWMRLLGHVEKREKR